MFSVQALVQILGGVGHFLTWFSHGSMLVVLRAGCSTSVTLPSRTVIAELSGSSTAWV
jgi:hypothetical protein